MPQNAIFVLAGPNGGGKSSVAGAAFRGNGNEYFNPDEYANELCSRIPDMSREDANSLAWHHGRELLTTAIEGQKPYAFETTLGGSTIPNLLVRAAEAGIPVRVWYVALESADLHVDRVRQRVERGGHDIPEIDIRRRYDSSRANLAEMLPHMSELRIFDNSETASGPAAPKSILHFRDGEIVECLPLPEVPEWARGIVAAAVAASS